MLRLKELIKRIKNILKNLDINKAYNNRVWVNSHTL